MNERRNKWNHITSVLLLHWKKKSDFVMITILWWSNQWINNYGLVLKREDAFEQMSNMRNEGIIVNFDQHAYHCYHSFIVLQSELCYCLETALMQKTFIFIASWCNKWSRHIFVSVFNDGTFHFSFLHAYVPSCFSAYTLPCFCM